MSAKCPCCGGDVSKADKPLISLDTNKLMAGGEVLKLAPMEAEIIAVLVEAMPRPVDHERLIAKLWGGNPISAPQDSIGVRISHLRKKIAPTGLQIKTHWGRGYALEYRDAA
jgi:DNA-binding response OmpR family regulator